MVRLLGSAVRVSASGGKGEWLRERLDAEFGGEDPEGEREPLREVEERSGAVPSRSWCESYAQPTPPRNISRTRSMRGSGIDLFSLRARALTRESSSATSLAAFPISQSAFMNGLSSVGQSLSARLLSRTPRMVGSPASDETEEVATSRMASATEEK